MSIAMNMVAVVISNGAVRALGLISLLLVRRLLGPTLTGAWNLIQLISGYAVTVSLGAEMGADRNIPYWHGKGDRIQENNSRNQMFSSALSESLLVSFVLIVAATFAKSHYRPEVISSFYWAALYVPLWRLSSCFLISLRTRNQFVLLGKAQVFLSLLDVVVTVGLVYLWGLVGQITAFGISLLARIVVFWKVIADNELFKIRWHFTWQTLSTLLPVGFPLMLYAFLVQFFLSVDSLIVAKRLGITVLGYYSLAMSASRAMAEIPTAFSSVVYPRLMQDYGANDSLEGLGIILYRNLKVAIFALAPAVACVLYFLLPLAIRYGVPAFSPSIPTVKLLILTGFVYSLTNISIQVLIAHKQSVWMLSLLGAITGMIAGLVWWMAPHGIWWVGLTVLICHFLYYSILTFIVFKMTIGLKMAVRRLAVLTSALFYLTAVLVGIDKLWNPMNPGVAFMTDLGSAALKTAVALLLLGILFWRADRHLGLVSRAKALWPLPQ